MDTPDISCIEDQLPAKKAKKRRDDRGKRCAVFGCGNTNSNSDFGIHAFPNRDRSPERFSAWCKVVLHTRKDFSWKAATSFVCSAHFEDDKTNKHRRDMQREMSQKPDRWQLHPDAIPSVALLASRPKHDTPVGLGLQSSPDITTGGLDNTADVLFTTPKGRPKRNAAAKRERKRDKAGIGRAGAEVASSALTDPVWSGQENALCSNEEIIEKKKSKSKEIKTKQSSSDEYLDGNESKVYIDVAEHPEDLRKRKHFMGDWEEFPSDSDGRKYIKSEDDIDEKIDISKECMLAEPYEEQETLRDWSQVTDASLTNIKQEPDSDNIVLSREMT